MGGHDERRDGAKGSAWGPIAVVVFAVVAMTLYANASLWVTDSKDYRYFPPFQRNYNQYDIKHLGAEYNHIADALVAGRGFADPFPAHTGPTAWMPPILSWILAALKWDSDGDVNYVKTAVIVLQGLTLIGTGIVLVAVGRRTVGGGWLTAILFVGSMCYYFRHAFQFTHDCWIVLAAMDVLMAGLVFLPPATDRGLITNVVWGITGGLIALSTPVVGFIWGLFALAGCWRPGRRAAFAVSVAAAVLTVSPWVARNYRVFGRFIPVKSNLAFELYQSQCVQEDGVLHHPIWDSHPNHGGNAELREYARLGEMAFMDRKWEQFRDSVRANPGEFGRRVWNRFLEATLVYLPFNKQDEDRRPWLTWLAQLIYPLPFLCMIGLVATAAWKPLGREQWIVIAIYVAYLTPYILVSYYERYKYPLLVTETLLLVWGINRLVNMGVQDDRRLELNETTAKSQAAFQEIAS
jgi:hypothetical protein